MRIAVTLLIVLAIAGTCHAQIRGVSAEVGAIVAVDGVHPGTLVRAALQVKLPEGFHVQSNKPRDPSLIPTTLRFDAADPVKVREVVFPPPVDQKVLGYDQPLAVFEREFVIGVQLVVPSSVAVGNLIVPGHLRYQACNDTTCFPPKTIDAVWMLRVVTADTPIKRLHEDIIDRIAFGHGEAPSAASDPTGREARIPTPES